MTRGSAGATGRSLCGEVALYGVSRSLFGPSLAALLVAVVACNAGDYDLGPGDTLHPNEMNAAPSDASVVSADSLPEGMSSDELRAWKEARDAILGARTVLSLGTDNEGPELFGAITDVEVDANGNLVVFDMSTQEIRFFDRDGRYLSGFGGFGDGPMEFRDATRLSVLRDGRVVVPEARRLKMFAPSEDGWRLDTLVSTPFTAMDICAGARSHLFLSDYHRENDEVVHRVSLAEDDGIFSIRAPYNDDNWLVRWRMTEGLIACLPDQSRFAYAQFAMPLLRAYSEGGVLLWTARVAGHKTLRLRERAEGPVSLQRHLEHDGLSFLQGVSPGHFVVQYHRYRRRRPVGLKTYLIDASTGIGASLGDDVPAIAAVYDGGFVAVFQEPYPRLEVRASRGRGGKGAGR